MNLKFKIKNLKLPKAGFTLIELLVAIALVAIVTAVAIPNLRQFNKTQEIDGATGRFTDSLKIAQSSANSSIQCPNQEVSIYWYVKVNSNNYSLIANCKNSGDKVVMSGPYASTATSTTTFSASTDKCLPGEGMSIYFKPFATSYKCASGAETTGNVRITIGSGDFSKDVIVETGGTIRNE